MTNFIEFNNTYNSSVLEPEGFRKININHIVYIKPVVLRSNSDQNFKKFNLRTAIRLSTNELLYVEETMEEITLLIEKNK